MSYFFIFSLKCLEKEFAIWKVKSQKDSCFHILPLIYFVMLQFTFKVSNQVQQVFPVGFLGLELRVAWSLRNLCLLPPAVPRSPDPDPKLQLPTLDSSHIKSQHGLKEKHVFDQK